MSFLNLHAIVTPAIRSLHPEVTATLYRSTGQTTGAGGGVKSVYAPGVDVSAQMQPEGGSALFHSGRVGMEEVSRTLYLFSPPEPAVRVAGIVRPLSRNGDMLQLKEGGLLGDAGGEAPPAKESETWWLVEAVLEDFSRSGWVSVRATLQVNPPDFTYSGWWMASGSASDSAPGALHT